MPQSRKWQLTFNNPAEHGFTHDAIVEAIENLASVVYWCLCDETGSEGTYHTHLYICFQNPKLHTVIGNAFPGAHRENVKGTSQQNRDYVLKDGEPPVFALAISGTVCYNRPEKQKCGSSRVVEHP